jgi:hypothetical protein
MDRGQTGRYRGPEVVMTETFAIVPAQMKASTLAILLPVGLVLLVVTVVLGAAVLGSQRARFEVSPEGLRIRGDLYGRLVPAATLRGSQIRAVDLSQERGLRPVARTFGTGLPSYRSGWFRLANGDKALLYLTDPGRAVYAPTTAGWSVLVSTDRPAEMVERLRAIAGVN